MSSATVHLSAMIFFCLAWCDWVAVVVADHIGGAAVEHGPGPFGEVPGDDAAGFEVGGAPLGHLQVVDPGELGVLPAGGVGGAEERGAQQRRQRGGGSY